MDTFLSIMLYASLVLGGLSLLAFLFVFLAKFLRDTTHDPEAEH